MKGRIGLMPKPGKKERAKVKAIIFRSVLSWSQGLVDHNFIYVALGRLEFQPPLLLQGREQRRRTLVHLRNPARGTGRPELKLKLHTCRWTIRSELGSTSTLSALRQLDVERNNYFRVARYPGAISNAPRLLTISSLLAQSRGNEG